MTIQKLFIFPLLLTIGIFPFTMNSADVYERARGGGKIIVNLNGHIVPEDNKLSSTVFIISSREEYKDPQIFSKCGNSQKLALTNKIGANFVYLISFSYIGNCGDSVVYVKNGDEIYTDTAFTVSISDYSKNFVDFTDSDNRALEQKIAKLDMNSFKLDNEIYNLSQKYDLASKIILIKTLYVQKYEQYENIFLSNILSTRKNLKYIPPVAGRYIPVKKNIIPNAGRPYRSKYTDGIHHGWDLFAAHGTPTRALADGVIVRIVNDFSWSNFDDILWRNINDEDRAKNLDIYRGNQIWLKTADGNITIYSHLENIPKNLKQWQVVKSGEYFGQVGKSGVPDKEYKDFHLHFEVQLNPYTKSDNSPSDVMEWKYLGKGKNYETLIREQSKLFAAGSIATK